jgi:hypothetical protein
MSTQTVRFVLSPETDANYQQALQQLNHFAAGYDIAELSRDVRIQDGRKVAFAVITLKGKPPPPHPAPTTPAAPSAMP